MFSVELKTNRYELEQQLKPLTQFHLEIDKFRNQHPELVCKENPFDTDKVIFRLAFKQICDDIKFVGCDKERVYQLLYEARNGQYGLAHRLKAEIITVDWNWFDEWLSVFQNFGKFPYMWKTDYVSYPKTIDEATKRLTINIMKSLLVRAGYFDIPKLRCNIEDYFKQHIKYEDIQPELKERMLSIGWTDEYKDLKIDLLVHTVRMRAYALRDHDACRPSSFISGGGRFAICPCTPSLSFIADGCIEEKIVMKLLEPIKNNEVLLLPPFFPGGRSSIRYSHKAIYEELID